uniref:P-type domain-containing protein n=1 Tax=Neolamprologus brichardi TaxID=32507 RepID=A0A3Q4G932_NEOBR
MQHPCEKIVCCLLTRIQGSECAMAPESRFDCGRDKLLSQSECEDRGCCYAPLPDSAGPPWCFYPLNPLKQCQRLQRISIL